MSDDMEALAGQLLDAVNPGTQEDTYAVLRLIDQAWKAFQAGDKAEADRLAAAAATTASDVYDLISLGMMFEEIPQPDQDPARWAAFIAQVPPEDTRATVARLIAESWSASEREDYDRAGHIADEAARIDHEIYAEELSRRIARATELP